MEPIFQDYWVNTHTKIRNIAWLNTKNAWYSLVYDGIWDDRKSYSIRLKANSE